jgi:hypothetical protein
MNGNITYIVIPSWLIPRKPVMGGDFLLPS